MRNFQALASLNLLIAAVQTGFGPFLNLSLTAHGWNQTELGLALGIGTITTLACQVPGGALVDAIHNKRVLLAAALAVTGASTLLLGICTDLTPVVAGEIMHAAASTVVTPAIAAVTLTVCNRGAFGELLGSNVKWASLGTVAAAVLIGPLTTYISSRLVFPLTALFCVSALPLIWRIRPSGSGESIEDHPALMPPRERRRLGYYVWVVYSEMQLHRFALCVLLFQAANAAMLRVALSPLPTADADLAVSASIVISQAVVATLSIRLGRHAERRGRRPLLMLGFAALPVRGLLMVIFPGAVPLICIQALDGISAAAMGIAIPLISADVSRRSGFLNLAIGSFGLAAGIGATVSNVVGGWLVDHVGSQMALLALTFAGVLAFVLVWLAMPETRLSSPADIVYGSPSSIAGAPGSVRNRVTTVAATSASSVR